MPEADGVRSPDRHGLIDRAALVAELDRAVTKQVTVVSAAAGSGKTSLLRLWAARVGQGRIAFLSVRPGQHEAQGFWLALLGAVRGTPPPAATPDFDGPAMAAKVLAEISAGGPFFLMLDDLHELTSAEATEQLVSLLANLPPNAHAIVATRRDVPGLHKLRLAGELGEIRDDQLRFTERETRELLSAQRLALPDESVAVLHRRTEG